MLKTGSILTELYERLTPRAVTVKVIDLRIGLGYIGVRLDSGKTGIAAALPDMLPSGCTVVPAAGSFAGAPAPDLLQYLIYGKNALETAIGLATANALIEQPSGAADDREATTYLHLQKGVKVAMVGLFAPLVDRIESTGAELTVIEKNPARRKILSDAEKKVALQACDVAIITATTLLNSTFEETIRLLGTPRSVVVMGPSTPLLPVIFRDTPVTHLGGVFIADPARVMQIISEGGGTPALRPHLRFVNQLIK
jgi:uncharacterized protein